MLFFILAIVVFVIGVLLTVFNFADGEKVGAGISAVVTVIICAVLIGIACFRSVPTGHTGVVTVFGKVENYTLNSGAHFMSPWKKVVNMDNRVQKATVDLPCFSSDIQEVNVSYTLNYQISKVDAMTLYSAVGKEYYDTVIAPNVAEAVKVVTARYTAEQLVGMRDDLASEIEVVLGEKMEQFNIEIRSTSIENMDFTDVFTNAVEAKQVAQQEKLRAQTEAEQKVIEAEAAAEVKKVNADAKAYEIKINAEAEAEANQKIADSLTPSLINYLYAQGWDGKLPTVMSGQDGSVILNAGDIFGD